MKKTLRKIIIGAACCSLVVPFTVPLAACGRANDVETRPVTLALGAVDQNFNPFFYTALNDGEVVSQTQLPLITADTSARLTCGQDEATVALAYKSTMYDSRTGGNVTTVGNENGRTEYEFVIKNGIKFSDGVDLTIKDVLFNLYVYLDPMYSGSSTIYSTKIQGLAAYRGQQVGLSDDDNDDYASAFAGELNRRFQNLVDYGTLTLNSPSTPEIEADMLIVATQFREELNMDWTANVGTISSYEENYNFTEDWEVFYFNEGLVGYQRNPDGTRKKGENGKFLTHIDEGGEQLNLRTAMEEALSAGNVNAYASANNVSAEIARQTLMQQQAVKTLFDEYISNYEFKDSGTFADGEFTKADKGSGDALRRLLTEWNVGVSVRQQLLNKIMSDAYEGSELVVKSISGITTYNTAETPFTTAGANETAGSPLNSGENYDVLKIVINGVDPAAKWNFGFTVAPMHYYSNEEYTNIAKNTASNDDTVSNRFGVRFANQYFFDSVLNAPAKTARPVGAGPYKALNNRIFGANIADYERNTYFETVGTGIHNPIIKYLRYRVITDDQLVNTLVAGGVDFGMPNCNPDNVNALDGQRHLSQLQYDSNGFGYVGINPKYVPERGVRQAIMKAMNVNTIVNYYYTSQYASTLYRPITTTSWVYTDTPENQRDNYFGPYVGQNGYNLRYVGSNTEELEALIEDAGYTKPDGKYQKDGKPLKLTFTIAGESTDHPAYRMFSDAAEILNEIGCDITVQYDIQALAKLATGRLSVWAAAWSTGIDPDMYQVFHKDSKASSVRNWGYDVILQNTGGVYDLEQDIVNELSDLIMEARNTNSQDVRRTTYYQALNKVMDLAVELPTYQRKDLAVFNTNVIKLESLNTNANANAGVLNRIWELDFV